MAKELDCEKNLHIALVHLENDSIPLAMAALTAYEGCHLAHKTCPYRGEDCAVQDLIEGFFKNQ
jgi:hypothetical protein